jgi:hypothetical protein
VDILGPVPAEWWDCWEARGEYFDEDGRPVTGRFVFPSLEEIFETDVQAARRKDNMGEFGAEEKEVFLGMLRPMLVFGPEERATAVETLNSLWMREWGLPSVERMGEASSCLAHAIHYQVFPSNISSPKPFSNFTPHFMIILSSSQILIQGN